MDIQIKPLQSLRGAIKVPGDKSISHRAVMFGSIAQGTTEISGFLMGQDCLSTIRCFRQLGIEITINEDKVIVEGKGLQGLREPDDVLDVGNSGTTIRLISGILAGQNFTTTLTGDHSIRRRPMGRVTEPLGQMGAFVVGRDKGRLAPLSIKGGNLQPINYHTPVASAQVKSAVILAGLFTQGWTQVTEPEKSRNHTELMLKAFGAEIVEEELSVKVKGFPQLKGQKITVPGDISSAAFFMVAAAIVAGSSVIIENVGLNKTRSGIIDVLKEMGANIEIVENYNSGAEPMGTIKVQSSPLRGIKISGSMIPRLIDEIPIIAVAAVCAQGVTEIRDAEELKVKESNRLQAIAVELRKLGAEIEELPDGLRIYGGRPLKGAVCESYSDHRIAMATTIAGLVAQGETKVQNAEIIDVSFPGFFETLQALTD